MKKKNTTPFGKKMELCRFSDFLSDEPKKLPCKKCQKKKQPFSATSHEYGGSYYWMTAVGKHCRAITFRIPRRPKGRDAQWRYDEILKEYENHLNHYIESEYRRFPKNETRAWMTATAKANGYFSGFLGFELVKFRNATACEVMCWMLSHKEDVLTLKDPAKLYKQIEGFAEE
jgi:hypothetical protein